jgi:hypothetical protein
LNNQFKTFEKDIKPDIQPSANMAARPNSVAGNSDTIFPKSPVVIEVNNDFIYPEIADTIDIT